MDSLTSFKPGSNAVVIGSSGGIGRSFVSALEADPSFAQVSTFSRSNPDRGIDLADEASIERAANSVGDELDLVIVATGILHDQQVQPEKAMRELDGSAMATVLAANTIGPALVAKHFLPRLRRDSKTVFAALSARVGSISDNRLGGWTSYRASKAALNMVIRTLSIEQARRRPESVVVGLHPGTVDTKLSAPFQRNVPQGKLFTPEIAATHLLRVIDGLQSRDSGGFFAWDGQAIDF
jgi:NAD(P)-dependent dehydrogenase (short-subunit alcohol dehydrogenase family)